MFQQTILIGNLGQDPEARCTPTGKWVTHFSLAVNEKYGDRETTTWFRVEAWGKLGELCQQYLAKGRLVMVVGRVSASAYTGNDGKARCSLTLTEQTVKFLGAGRGGQDIELMEEKLDHLLQKRSPEDTAIISGMANGADTLGTHWAEEHGFEVMRFPADWTMYGKSAGYKRNHEMLAAATGLVAFWDGRSRGTAHMIQIAREAGIKVVVIRY